MAHFTREIWQALGHKSASLGTLGWVTGPERQPGSLTTPDPVTLHRTLSELAGREVDHAAIEASSHGLAQYRLDGIEFAAAAFTNLTRDHLDYHGDMEPTARPEPLFTALMPGGTAVINADSRSFNGSPDSPAHGAPASPTGVAVSRSADCRSRAAP